MFISYALSIFKGPIYGFIAYIFIYFNPPFPEYNWWAMYVPTLNWSFITAGIWVLSAIIHHDQLSSHKFGTVYWVFIFTILSKIIAETVGVDLLAAREECYKLFVYCIAIILIIKTLAKKDQLRSIILIVVVMTVFLVITTYTQGKFIHGRLENVGPSDAFEANELGILLASILPFTLPYILKGKKYEKVICILMIPLILNVFAFTLSRSALVSLIGSFLVVALLSRNIKVLKSIIVVAIVGAPLLLYLADPSWFERVSSLWKTDTSSEQGVNVLSSGRWETWIESYRMLQDYPFGAGPGGYRALSRFYISDLTYHPEAEYGVRAAHNSYLLVLVEQGFLGFGIFLIICFSIISKLLKSASRIKQLGMAGSFDDLQITGIHISFFCTLVGGFFNSRLYYEFFWWQVALAIVAASFAMNMQNTEGDKVDSQRE